ncbi:MAG: ATP-dependent Clp protease proteolytic subunit [Actinomycetota bacterium]|nr:ATP-dependent Clp protease proteolytic subunit [Actinomycetota bacterium]
MVGLIWLFFVVSSFVQPLLQQRMLLARRLAAIHRLEGSRGSRVITLIHRQEAFSFFGFPFGRYIDVEDSEAILRAIELTDPGVPIDLIVHTPGGLVLAAEQIANALAHHPAAVTVMVPHYAMSGGTLIALAAGRILMAQSAVLGPVDPQIGKHAAASILAAVERKDVNDVDDETLIMADMAGKARDQVRVFVVGLLVGNGTPEDEADRLAGILSEGRWTHDYPITVRTAIDLGLRVSTELPSEAREIMALYSQPKGRRPSVEYVPQPYRDPSDDRPDPLA